MTEKSPLDDIIAEFIGFPIVFISPDRKLLYANKHARDLLAIEQDTNISSVSCCDLLDMNICGADCPTKRIRSRGEVVHDYFVKRRCSKSVYCVSTSVISDEGGKGIGIVHSIKDMEMVQRIIEEQKRTHEQLQLHQLKMQAILESIADGVFTVNGREEITHFSKSMERITGFSCEEVLGKQCRTVMKGTLCDLDCPIAWSIESGERIESCGEMVVNREGKTLPVHITTSPIRESGVIMGVVCSVHDRSEVEMLRQELRERTIFPEIIGGNRKMRDLFSQVESVAGSDVTILISGETGTGKELLARALHQRSGRNRGPFVAVNCAALPLFLLESELFGHAKGAFTDAVKDRIGKFESAEGGTLFLDEISEVNHETQLKLLRFLQSKEFERLGETATRKVDVRIIAATNKDIRELVKKGSFREDLYYRLNVFPLRVPSLRERKEDIPLLVEHFLQKHRKMNCLVEGVSPRALRSFIEYNWPGNVRELENAVMYAMASCSETRLKRTSLPPDIRKVPTANKNADDDHVDVNPLSIERQRIMTSLIRNGWKIDTSAESLGLSRTTLWRRMKKFGIRVPNRRD